MPAEECTSTSFGPPFASALTLGLFLAGLVPADGRAEPGPLATLCSPEESDVFTCHLKNRKTASLCARSAGSEIGSISYRYGSPGKVELSYTAALGGTNQFFVFESPAAPRAHVQQLWFDLGRYSYVLTECVGGSCRHPAGLLVLRGTAVVSARTCVNAYGQQPTLHGKVVNFGATVQDIQPLTPLVKYREADNGIFSLYGVKGPFEKRR